VFVLFSATDNLLETTSGLEGCASLLHADLANNAIETVDALRPLASLSALGGLQLEDNPIAKLPAYRVDVLNALQQLQALDLYIYLYLSIFIHVYIDI